jgi:hypothetical protein
MSAGEGDAAFGSNEANGRVCPLRKCGMRRLPGTSSPDYLVCESGLGAFQIGKDLRDRHQFICLVEPLDRRLIPSVYCEQD